LCANKCYKNVIFSEGVFFFKNVSIDFVMCFTCIVIVYTAVPSVIKKKLDKGLPVHWKMMMKTWASLMLPANKN